MCQLQGITLAGLRTSSTSVPGACRGLQSDVLLSCKKLDLTHFGHRDGKGWPPRHIVTLHWDHQNLNVAGACVAILDELQCYIHNIIFKMMKLPDGDHNKMSKSRGSVRSTK